MYQHHSSVDAFRCAADHRYSHWLLLRVQGPHQVGDSLLLMVIVVAGCAMVYSQGANPATSTRRCSRRFYLMAFLFGGNPLIVSWMIANTAVRPRSRSPWRSSTPPPPLATIVGPLLFKSVDAPYYTPGTRAVMGIFVALIGCIAIQVVLLWLYNKQRQSSVSPSASPRSSTTPRWSPSTRPTQGRARHGSRSGRYRGLDRRQEQRVCVRLLGCFVL